MDCTCTSLVSELLWMFKSKHGSTGHPSVSLDKRGTYYVLKVENGVLAQYRLGMKYSEEVRRECLIRMARQFLEDCSCASSGKPSTVN